MNEYEGTRIFKYIAIHFPVDTDCRESYDITTGRLLRMSEAREKFNYKMTRAFG